MLPFDGPAVELEDDIGTTGIPELTICNKFGGAILSKIMGAAVVDMAAGGLVMTLFFPNKLCYLNFAIAQ